MSTNSGKYRVFKSTRGSSTVIFAIVLVAITTVSALTVDIGLIMTEKARLSSAVDSAALAGAQELISNNGNTRNIVDNYLLKNSGSLKEVSVKIDSNTRTLEVAGIKTVDNFFARIFGQNSQDISASATARVENIKTLKGARPLAVVQQTFTYGSLYTLKEGAGDGSSGNYQAISLGGNGGSIYRDNLLYGYDGTISVGDQIPTETGNIAGTTQTCISQLMSQCNHTPLCTYQNYNSSCSKIIFIPVVNTMTVNGKKYIKVLGFGTFFLEGVENKGGQTDVVGRFITYSMSGETSNQINDYGTYGIRLIK